MDQPVERDGVFRGKDGQLYLPATQRPDGTWRKPIRVKEGYVPQEEVPVYLTRAAQIEKTRNDPSFIPGLAVDDQRKLKDDHERQSAASRSTGGIVGLTAVTNSESSATSNASTKKKKTGKSKGDGNVDKLSNAMKGAKISDTFEYSFEIPSAMRSDSSSAAKEDKTSDRKQESGAGNDLDSKSKDESEAESAERRLRALRKKRKEINQLEERVRNGTLPNPNDEQRSKLERRKAIDEEIEQLERTLRS